MTKNVMKIGAVVLLICMLSAVGVSSVGAEVFEHNNGNNAYFLVLPADFIWDNDNVGTDKLNWTYVNAGNPILMIEAGVSDGAYKYLSAYNISLGGDLTALPGYEFKNPSLYDAFTNKSWNVSATHMNNGSLEQIDDTTFRIVNVSLDKAFTYLSGSTYNSNNGGILKTMYVNESGALALLKQNVINSIKFDDFSRNVSIVNTGTFELYIRENQPNIEKFNFVDYVDEIANETGKVYIYREHGNTSVVTDSDKLNVSFDNTKWYTRDGASFYVLNGNTITGSKTENLATNEIGWSYQAEEKYKRMETNSYETILYVDVNPGLNDYNGTQLVNTTAYVNVNVSNWNRSLTNNTFPSGSSEFSNGLDDKCWNFVTGLGYNYTVGAATMNITNTLDMKWQSWVPITMLNDRVWNATVTYKRFSTGDFDTDFEINGVTNGSKLMNIGLNNLTFNVTKNDIKDGTDNGQVFIILSGLTKGDADMDGDIDIVDSSVVGITIIQNAESVADPMITTDMENFMYADCNEQGGSGNLDVADVLAINRYLVGHYPWDTTIGGATNTGEKYNVDYPTTS